jgi:uncharacterized protein YbjT (DUF2867 family)
MATYLVTCATGQQGNAAIKHLLQAGAKIHAVVRNPLSGPAQKLQSQGVVLFEGDNDDVDVFRLAAQGCKGLFLCLMPARGDRGSEPRQARGIVQACEEAGVEIIVTTTSAHAADRDRWDNEENEEQGLVKYFVDKAGVEDVVRSAGVQAYTIIRPAWFHSNYLLPYARYHVPDLLEKGEFVHAINNGVRIPHVDVDDVGKYVAAALLYPGKFGGEEFDLANENLTAREAWDILRKASGRDIGFKRRSPAEEDSAKAMITTQKFHLWANRKNIQVDGQKIQKKYGIPLASLEEYLEREKELLAASLPA